MTTDPRECETCGDPTDTHDKLCARCRIIRSEEMSIWDTIEGSRW